MLLKDQKWKKKYSAHKLDLVDSFYLHALSCAQLYDRTTGYFRATALSMASRGLEGLVLNNGRMRMIVGCTLNPPEVDAIQKGEDIASVVEKKLALPLDPPGSHEEDALELLAWMVAKGFLQIRVGIPCDSHKVPQIDTGIFHEKAGILEDKTGDVLAFVGSVNESVSGWRDNRETLHVYTSWSDDVDRVNEERGDFEDLWENRQPRTLVLDVPTAARNQLLEFLPEDDKLPKRLQPAPKKGAAAPPPKVPAPPPVIEPPPPAPQILPEDLRRLVWGIVQRAPSWPKGGDQVGEATAAVKPWPHQQRAFQRMYSSWPTKLLVADEVGLGKTIQAGMLLRQAWMAGRAKRILVLVPAGVLRQWQIELREKFNLNWPIYTGDSLRWPDTPALRGKNERTVSRADWHKEPCILASSHLMRRRDRFAEMTSEAAPWDLIVLDEAHHARRRGGVGSVTPNALLRLMRSLRNRTQALLLMTATPMQVAPLELWDLLDLLGLPLEWGEQTFVDYFALASKPNPLPEELDKLAKLFQSLEKLYGKLPVSEVQRLAPNLSGLRAKKVLEALRDPFNMPRRQLDATDRSIALKLLKIQTPVKRLVSRNTRELLRRYHQAGKMDARIADRKVDDLFVDLVPDEQAVYSAVEDYISNTYNQASPNEKSAIGFVMTVYRRRLASSFRALATTLASRKAAVNGLAGGLLSDEDLPDEDEVGEEGELEDEDAQKMSQEALAREEVGEIDSLLLSVRRLKGPDTKTSMLRTAIKELQALGYRQIMVFTQYFDTLEYLREELVKDGKSVMCFSGNGGEVRSIDGHWSRVSRDEIKRRFRKGEAEILLCTDAAAEGLNFQFCGALVNYDMPWNPMRVEQRIGRIDRLGQAHQEIRVVNLHYRGTVETQVYIALRDRIKLFEKMVGRLQPILAQLPKLIAQAALTGRRGDSGAMLVNGLDQQVSQAQESGLDIDEITDADLEAPGQPAPYYGLAELDSLMRRPELLPPGCSESPLDPREYSWVQPGMDKPLRVTTNPDYYEAHSESVELWSPGSPLFPTPAPITSADEALGKTLAEVLSKDG